MISLNLDKDAVWFEKTKLLQSLATTTLRKGLIFPVFPVFKERGHET